MRLRTVRRSASCSGADAAASKLTATKPQIAFWLTAAAVSAFVEGEGGGLLPVLGTLPDMTSDTATYVSLQNIFLQQAQADVAAVQAHMREIASIEGLPSDLVSPDYLKLFCKNSHGLQVYSYRPAAAEYDENSVQVANFGTTIDDETSCGALYLLLRSARSFRAERSRWPGASTLAGRLNAHRLPD